jgi:hypothetical protein
MSLSLTKPRVPVARFPSSETVVVEVDHRGRPIQYCVPPRVEEVMQNARKVGMYFGSPLVIWAGMKYPGAKGMKALIVGLGAACFYYNWKSFQLVEEAEEAAIANAISGGLPRRLRHGQAFDLPPRTRTGAIIDGSPFDNYRKTTLQSSSPAESEQDAAFEAAALAAEAEGPSEG